MTTINYISLRNPWCRVFLKNLIVVFCSVNLRNPLFDRVPRQVNIFHTFTLCFFKIHFNNIMSFMCYFPSGFFLSDFPTKILYLFVIYQVCYMSFPCKSLYNSIKSSSFVKMFANSKEPITDKYY
jgi:hypothetical protein